MSKPETDHKSHCPICHRPTVTAYRPFCSKRCADIDLARWLHGDYSIPSVENEAGEDETGDDANSGEEFT